MYVPMHACYKTKQSACEVKSCAKENCRAMGALNLVLLTDDFNRFVVAVQKRTQQKQDTKCFANAITTTQHTRLSPRSSLDEGSRGSRGLSERQRNTSFPS